MTYMGDFWCIAILGVLSSWKEEYRPFGKQLLKENDENDRWYTGKQHEEDFGLSYFGARWYNPDVGRFVSIDPAGVVPTNLHSYNRYAYGNNNPYKYVDPDGNNPKLVVDFALNVGINYLTTGQLGLASAAIETVKGALNPLATLNKIHKLSKLAVSIRKANAGMAAAGPVTKKAVHKNSRDYVGETHVYAVRNPNGTVNKIGESATGTRVRDGASKRAEQQVRKLNREVGPGHTSEIRKTFPNKDAARTHETNVIERYRRMYGQDTLPGNKTNR